MEFIRKMLARKTPEDLRREQLYQAKILQLDYQSQAEHSNAMVTMLDTRIARLQAEILVDDANDAENTKKARDETKQIIKKEIQ